MITQMLVGMRRMAGALVVLGLCISAVSHLTAQAPYFPPAGAWAKKTPAELGMDAAKLAEAVAFAQSHESTRAMDFSD